MDRFLLRGMVAASLFLAAAPALATDISFTTAITQDQFKSLTKEAGAALGYRNMAPAEPLGILGFDIGAELSAVGIDKNSSYWSSAFGNDAPSYLVIPKIRARKGLPFGIDVGGMYSYVPSSNIKLYGAEISKSILDGTAATPALGIRATYTKLSGVSDLSLQTYGVDASVSKGLLFITPYAGAGILWINSEAKGNLKALVPTLESESTTVPRLFAGVKITPFPLVGITAEAEYAERPIYSLKAAISF
ncbi:MAG: hypothetical protein PHP95_05350 [Desulfuromonadaceae bacterium]|nr:hypothetical protein [Desulfuromonadaceae bacterium]MDD2847865.1 hypothetical protein [Desulfuromonadaceae bacterium]MDD4129590.1 hypothetical protein [Desulfuromonadaceae bacterium]